MSNTVEIRLSEEELEILRSCLEDKARKLSEELEESMDNSCSDTEIIEVAGKLRTAQAAKFKLDVPNQA